MEYGIIIYHEIISRATINQWLVNLIIVTWSAVTYEQDYESMSLLSHCQVSSVF